MMPANAKVIMAHIKYAKQNSNGQFKLYVQRSRLNEIHFDLYGPPDSSYEGGKYHGVIKCPTKYPFEPPEVIFLSATGRFEPNVSICLSYRENPGLWQPTTGIAGLLFSVQSLFMDQSITGTGFIDKPSPEMVLSAKQEAANFICQQCGKQEIIKQGDNVENN